MTFDAGFRPDPQDAVDTLAFVLCPARAFAPGGDAKEWETIGEVMKPLKAEAIRRWSRANSLRRRS